MTGVNRTWISGNDFIMIHLDLVDALGGSYEAAALLNRIVFRGGDHGWLATKAEMRADTRITEWKLNKAIELLRNAGFVQSERESRLDATQRWFVVYQDEETTIPERDATSSTVRDETSRTLLSKKEKNSVGEEALFSAPTPPPPPSRRRPATRAPDEFPITDRMYEWLDGKVSDQEYRTIISRGFNLEAETERFLDYHRAHDKPLSDWTAGWRKWMSKALQEAIERSKR